MNRFKALLRAIARDARDWIARAAQRPVVHSAAALLVALALGGIVLPRREFAFLAGGALLGLGAGCAPAIRRRLRADVASREVRRDARVEGLTAGSFRLAGGGLLSISITAIVTDLGSSKAAVDLAITLVSAVAAAVLWRTNRRLRANPEQPPSPASVLWSFLLVAIGLGGSALAPNVWWLGACLAVLGAPIAMNARFRHAAMARHGGREGTFQRISNRWSRSTNVVGLVLAGMSTALTPLGWRGTAGVFALFFVALGLLVHLARAGSSEPLKDRVRALPAALLLPMRELPGYVRSAAQLRALVRRRPVTHRPDYLKLRSVRRQLALIVFVAATAQLAQRSLEPMLHAGGLAGTSSLMAAMIIGGSQVAMIPAVDRFAEGSNRSPRQMASRATAWFAPAALVGALAAGASWWWLTLPLAASWFAFVEVSSAGTSSATRVGLNRSGQIASLSGVLRGYVGMAIGTAAAGLPMTRHALGLGALLLIGATIAFGISVWTPRQTPTDLPPIRTTGTRLEIAIERQGAAELVATIRDDSGQRGIVELGDGDLLRARRPHDAQRAAERVPVLDLSAWTGEGWWPYRWLATWAGARGMLRDAPLFDSAGFVADALHGKVRWHGSDDLAFEIRRRENGIAILVVLPRPMRLTWYPDRWLDQSEITTPSGPSSWG